MKRLFTAVFIISLTAVCTPSYADNNKFTDGYSQIFRIKTENTASYQTLEAEAAKQKDRLAALFSSAAANSRLTPERSHRLIKAQNRWRKHLDLDCAFLESHIGRTASLRYKLTETAVRAEFMLHQTLSPEDEHKCQICGGYTGKRSALDGEARDTDGLTLKCKEESKKAVSTYDILYVIQREADRQDKLLNKLYKDLCGSLSDKEKDKLIDAQLAWLEWRSADRDYIYDPDGGSLSRIDASSDYLQKLAERVMWLEDIIGRQQ